jgi:hypothetical protein
VLSFEGDNWVYEDWASHIGIAASHCYLVLFGIIIFLSERENPKILKNFVRTVLLLWVCLSIPLTAVCIGLFVCLMCVYACFQAFLELWVGRGLFYILCAIWLYITTIHISDKHAQKVQPVTVPLPEEEMGQSFQFPVDLDAPETEPEAITVRAAQLFTDAVFEYSRAGTVLLLLGCGLAYLSMGLLCVGYFRDKQLMRVSCRVWLLSSFVSLQYIALCCDVLLCSVLWLMWVQIRDRKYISLQSERLRQHKEDLDILIEETDRKLQNV